MSTTNTLFTWENPSPIPFKSQISSMALSDKHLFLASFSGSIFLVNLESFHMDLHVSFSELVAPINKILVFSDVIKEIKGFIVTSSGMLFYMNFQYNEQFQVIKEKTQMISRACENFNVIELLYSPVMEILVMASESSIFYYKSTVEVSYFSRCQSTFLNFSMIRTF